MRSWYLVMSIFIGVIMLLIFLFSSFNNDCTTFSASLMSAEATSNNQLKYKNGVKALPWQLDAVSIGTVHTPVERNIPSRSDVQEISCIGRTHPPKALTSKEG
jgi:hypothetical protein